jgi:DNA-binding MarR family transcriptional regulator
MESLEELLNIAPVKDPCDLDLLVFFARHPDALITSDQLALLVGYDVTLVARSLDLLVEHNLVQRSQNPTHLARLYRFRAEHWDPKFQEILKIASTLEGRRQLRRLLNQRQQRSKRTPRNHRSEIREHKSDPREQKPNVSGKKEKGHG